MLYADAMKQANELMLRMAPLCRRISIAGSLRRLKEEVKDIEIVCEPKYAPDLTGIEMPMQEFHDEIAKLGKFNKRGPRYKQLVLNGINADIFIVSAPAQYGVIMAIRTGPKEFSQWAVTNRSNGGGLPDGSKVSEGAVVQRGEIITMNEEEDFLHFIGLDNVSPQFRTARWIDRVRTTKR